MPWSTIRCAHHREQRLRLEQRPGLRRGLVCDICERERIQPTSPIAAVDRMLQTIDRALAILQRVPKEMLR